MAGRFAEIGNIFSGRGNAAGRKQVQDFAAGLARLRRLRQGPWSPVQRVGKKRGSNEPIDITGQGPQTLTSTPAGSQKVATDILYEIRKHTGAISSFNANKGVNRASAQLSLDWLKSTKASHPSFAGLNIPTLKDASGASRAIPSPTARELASPNRGAGAVASSGALTPTRLDTTKDFKPIPLGGATLRDRAKRSRLQFETATAALKKRRASRA